MKHRTLSAAAIGAVLICSAAIGCSRSNGVMTKVPPGFPNGTQPVAPAPEVTITKLETAEERAQYLRKLKEDSTFDPQKHVELLQKYAKDSNEEVASAAKELLERQ
jgi:hypothetical protein